MEEFVDLLGKILSEIVSILSGVPSDILATIIIVVLAIAGFKKLMS